MVNKIPKNIRFKPESLVKIEELIEWQAAKDRTHTIEVAVDRFYEQTQQERQGVKKPILNNDDNLAEVSKYLGEVISMTNGSILHIVEQEVKDKVVELDLSGKGLTVLPPEISQLTNLSRLDLSFNQLSSLPPQLGQLSALRVLYLNDNQITTLPVEIGQLTQLMRLHIYNNQLTSLPPTIGNLRNLLSLYISRNNLQTLPSEIGDLSNLQWFDISHNQLKALPYSLANLEHLSRFYASNNPLDLPNKIIEEGGQAVLRYLRDIPKMEKSTFFNAKEGKSHNSAVNGQRL